MASAIQNLLNQKLGDGARATKFEVQIQIPFDDLFKDHEATSTLAKTSSFPGKTIDTIDLKFRGRSIPIRGQVKYSQTWDCTFYLTEDHKLKRAFETWIESINFDGYEAIGNAGDNLELYQTESENKYTTEIIISQLNFEMEKSAIDYTLHNVFPTSVSQVETSYESIGQINEFTVSFSYSHYTSSIHDYESGTTSMIDSLTQGITDGIMDIKSSLTKELTGGITTIGTEVANVTGSVTDYTEDKYKQVSGMFDEEESETDELPYSEEGKYDGFDTKGTGLLEIY